MTRPRERRKGGHQPPLRHSMVLTDTASHQGDGHGDCGTYWVSYPSGGQQILRGRPAMVFEHHAPVIVPEDETAPIVVLDPRVLIRSDGRVVYHPRDHLTCLPRWARDWLREHPDWGVAA